MKIKYYLTRLWWLPMFLVTQLVRITNKTHDHAFWHLPLSDYGQGFTSVAYQIAAVAWVAIAWEVFLIWYLLKLKGFL